MHRLPVASSLHPAGTFARVDNNVFGWKSETIELALKKQILMSNITQITITVYIYS